MTNQEAINELQLAIDLIKQDGKDWLDERDIPILEMAISALREQDLQPTCNELVTDTISRQAAINELKRISFSHWFECGEYLSEDTREIKIINSNKALEAIEALSSAQTLCGYDIEHLMLIANVLRKENLSPERVTDALTDIGRIVSMVRDEVRDEFEEILQKSMEQLFGAVSETVERRTDERTD